MDPVLSYYFNKDNLKLKQTLLKYKKYAQLLGSVCDKERALINKLCNYNTESTIFLNNAKLSRTQITNEIKITTNFGKCSSDSDTETETINSETTDVVITSTGAGTGTGTDENTVASPITTIDNNTTLQSFKIINILVGKQTLLLLSPYTDIIVELLTTQHSLLQLCRSVLESNYKILKYDNLHNLRTKATLVQLLVYLEKYMTDLNKLVLKMTDNYQTLSERLELVNKTLNNLYSKDVLLFLCNRFSDNVVLLDEIQKKHESVHNEQLPTFYKKCEKYIASQNMIYDKCVLERLTVVSDVITLQRVKDVVSFVVTLRQKHQELQTRAKPLFRISIKK